MLRAVRSVQLLLAVLVVSGCIHTSPRARLGERQGKGSASALVFRGMCDASAAIPLSHSLFIAVSDEDNVLRLYDADRPGPPLRELDFSAALGLIKPTRNNRTRSEESDLEAATRVGELAFFVTSHGRNSSGKFKAARLRFFATTAPTDGAATLVGQPYERLLDDLLAEPSLAQFNLRAASELAPKAEGGLNLEGMTARPDGGVLLGFRNPIPNGQALVVPLENPRELIRGNASARFGAPLSLNLNGLGVRGLSLFRGRYLIEAGHFDRGAVSNLFTWDGPGTSPRNLEHLDLTDFNPEGFFTPESRDKVLLLSDDGTRTSEAGVECKRLRNPGDKTFRGLWVTLP